MKPHFQRYESTDKLDEANYQAALLSWLVIGACTLAFAVLTIMGGIAFLSWVMGI